MLVEVNEAERDVDSGRAALALVGPHDRVSIVHRRADGAVLRLAGASVSGFVVDVEGGHTGRRTSASRSVPASTVATMLDRFAASETGWPGAIVWRDEVTGSPARRRSRPLASAVAVLVGLAAGIAAVVVLRRTLTVPWLCSRDGRDVDSVRLGNRGLPVGRGDECELTGGASVDLFDLGAGAAWAETVAAVVVGLAVWFVVSRAVAALTGR